MNCIQQQTQVNYHHQHRQHERHHYRHRHQRQLSQQTKETNLSRSPSRSSSSSSSKSSQHNYTDKHHHHHHHHLLKHNHNHPLPLQHNETHNQHTAHQQEKHNHLNDGDDKEDEYDTHTEIHHHNHHHEHHQHQNQHQHQHQYQHHHNHQQQQQKQQQHHHHRRPPNSTPLQFWYIIHVILFLIDITSSLTMTELKVPNHIMRFKTAVLGCRYNLDGESLYSVKWYKDGHEIYRYVPRDKPPGQAFPLPGVNIDLRNSTDTQVVLRRVAVASTGLYRCEVSGEAPAFNTVSESETMNVVVTPLHGPKITGGQSRYSIGDVVRVNCTSAPSRPVCHLSWLINGEPANRSYLKPLERYTVGRDGLEVARLGLEFRVRNNHFTNGDMKLKCVAKISSLYWQSNEESVENDKPHRAPALESRETIAAKSSTIAASASKAPLKAYSIFFSLTFTLAATSKCWLRHLALSITAS